MKFKDVLDQDHAHSFSSDTDFSQSNHLAEIEQEIKNHIESSPNPFNGTEAHNIELRDANNDLLIKKVEKLSVNF